MTHRPLIAAALLSCLAPLAAAQNASPDPRLRPVDAGRDDTGPLATSARVMPADLRLPIGFDRVYKLEAASRRRSGLNGDLYARQSGGITAVFPRSQYVMTATGPMAEVPAGTTFYLGKLPASVTGTSAPAGTERRAPANMIDLSARSERPASSPEMQAAPRGDRTGASRPAGADSTDPRSRPGLTSSQATPDLSRPERRTPPPRPTIFSDESLRSKKVGELLDKATAATTATDTNKTPRR